MLRTWQHRIEVTKCLSMSITDICIYSSRSYKIQIIYLLYTRPFVYILKEAVMFNMLKVRTSRCTYEQMSMILEFMEKYGDIHRLRYLPNKRIIRIKWSALIKQLNSMSDKHYRSEIQWGKVWSDFKTNTRKKLCKAINVADGGPAVKIMLTDLEQRALVIMQNKSANKNEEVETSLDGQEQEQDEDISLSNISGPEFITEVAKSEECCMDIPETSRQSPLIEDSPKPQQATSSHSQAIKDAVAELILQADKNGRDYARQRDRIDVDLERERIRQRDEELRLRDYELRERVRQRNVELQLQARWLEFMKEAMNLFKRHIDK